MTIQLTPEQWSHFQQEAKQPIQVCDPSQREKFVLLRAEVYDRFKALFEEVPVTEQERLFQLHAFGRRAGWDDTAMDVYDDLDPRRTS